MIFRYLANETIAFRKPYQVRTYTWCFAVPPRCSKYRTDYTTAYKQVGKNTAVFKRFRYYSRLMIFFFFHTIQSSMRHLLNLSTIVLEKRAIYIIDA